MEKITEIGGLGCQNVSGRIRRKSRKRKRKSGNKTKKRNND